MSPTLKIKVTPTPKIRGKMDVRFPANVYALTPLLIDRAGGNYTLSLDMNVFIDEMTLSFQPKDATLTALAALDSTAGLLTQTGADTFAKRTLTAGAALTVTDGDGVSGNPTVAVTDAELLALAGVTSAADRLFYFTGSGTGSLATFTSFGRSLVDDADASAARTTLGLVIGTNVQAFDPDLSAVAGLAATGLIARTAAGAASARTITGTANQITVTNGDGVAGNPTLSIPSNAALPGSPTTTTQTPSDNSTKIATTAYVDAQVAGSVAGVSSLNGQTGALVFTAPPQGRLTLQTGTPVMTATQSAKTTIYYTPYVGNQVPIYNGTNMVPTAVSEISVATTDTTKNPAAIGASKVNDWFVWNDSGTIRLSHGPDWTNDTTRSAGTALVMVNGIWLNSASITNGPAASRGTYVGTTRSNASSQLNWIYGGLATGGTMADFAIWNAYNRVRVDTMVRDSTASWTYAVANTWRAANGSATMRVNAVRGLDEDGIDATYYGLANAGAGSFGSQGVGLNSTSAPSGITPSFGGAVFLVPGPANYRGLMGLGYNYVSAIEFNNSTTANTYYGNAGVAFFQTGFFATLMQ